MKKARKRGRRTNAEKARARKIGLGIFLLSLFSFTSLGFIGRVATNLFRFFVGDFYMPMSLIAIAIGLYMILKKEGLPLNSKKTLGLIASMTGVLLFMHAYFFGPIINPELNPITATWRFYYTDLMQNSVAQSLGGGMVGALLYAVTHFLIAQIGTYVVSVLLVIWGIVLFFSVPMRAILTKVKEYLLAVGGWIKAKWQTSAENRQAKKKDKVKKSKEKQDEKQPVDIQSSGVKSETDDSSQPVLEIDHFQKRQSVNGNDVDSSVASIDETQAPGKNAANSAPEPEDDGKDVDFEITSEEENDEYKLPPITLLNKSKIVDQSNEYDLIQKNVKKLEETFESFGVNAKVTKANLGPAVTKYEIQPATGVKVSKIVSLSDDIALALAAKDIRMEAPIPGKALIGIEVPNQDVSMVSFKEIIEGQENNPDKLLEVPLGRDISGAVAMADLSKMPHVLVAGATGSGKSVSINTMITSLLMKAKPHQVKLMMIDPKMVELSVYNGIPHLLTPVVTNPRKAAQALQKVVQEMERRYELFAASGTRNITGYNLHVKEKNQSKEEALKILPFIVVIVDELADLMMVASNEVEDAIIRLAQMARAAGIHMILATQRPSVDVITGIIKANVPSRIAFAVSSGTDSRTILDSNGAEKLLGRGDMLFQPMGQNKPTRVQGAFISDEEVEAVVSFVKTQQEANYVEEMIPTDQPDANTTESEDELFDEAVDLIVDMQTASISMLQRRFRIGYNRAARMIDEMELRGIVGPHEGSKPRVVNMQKPTEDSDLNE